MGHPLCVDTLDFGRAGLVRRGARRSFAYGKMACGANEGRDMTSLGVALAIVGAEH